MAGNTRHGRSARATSAATVAQMLERSDFANRQTTGARSQSWSFYPLLQGYDSVAVEAD